MPIENFNTGIFEQFNFRFGISAFFILFLIFYSVFSLILFRQIQLMGKTLPTTLAPLIKAIAIIHLGIALSLLFAAIGAVSG